MAAEWVESLPLLMLPPLCTLWGKEAVLGVLLGEQDHTHDHPLKTQQQQQHQHGATLLQGAWLQLLRGAWLLTCPRLSLSLSLSLSLHDPDHSPHSLLDLYCYAKHAQHLTRTHPQEAPPLKAPRMSDLTRAVFAGRADLVANTLETQGPTVVCECDGRGRSALWWAARWGDASITSLLLAKGADAMQGDWDGVSPLGVASSQGHSECIQLLQSCEVSYLLSKARALPSSVPPPSPAPSPSPTRWPLLRRPFPPPSDCCTVSGSSLRGVVLCAVLFTLGDDVFCDLLGYLSPYQPTPTLTPRGSKLHVVGQKEQHSTMPQ